MVPPQDVGDAQLQQVLPLVLRSYRLQRNHAHERYACAARISVFVGTALFTNFIEGLRSQHLQGGLEGLRPSKALTLWAARGGEAAANPTIA